MRRSSKTLVALGTSMIALAIASPVEAQQADLQTADAPQAGDAENARDIIVTGTRVRRSGFTAPTPMTVIGSELFEERAAVGVGEVMTELPSFRATTSPTVRTVFGDSAYYADLRGLGSQRTLVLVDGRRHVPTSALGQVDLNLIPSIMIRRADVVTGGASAAWGSDAVAGVVNLIFKNDIKGIEVEASKGIAEAGDDATTKLAFVAGSGFAGDRGHITVGAEYSDDQGTESLYSRSWFKERFYLTNPNYKTNGYPAIVWGNNVEHVAMNGGGIITGARVGNGPLVTDTPLYNMSFGAGGVPYRFEPGSLVLGQAMFGTSNYGFGPYMNTFMKLPVERWSAYGHANYALTNSLDVFLEGSFAQSLGRFYGQPTKNDGFGSPSASAQSPLTAYRENPFLPASVTALMDERGFTSIQLGRVNQDIGGVNGTRRSQTYRIVGGLQGDIGGGWSWDAYAQYGSNHYRELTHNQRLEANWRRAIDVVTDPATGAPICRSLLSPDAETRAAAAGCVPYNMFGTDTASPQALAYVSGSSFLRQTTSQFVSAANLRGEPFSTWAGPVSLAAGVEYRREKLSATSDPLSQARAFSSRNPQPIAGDFHVAEAYGELVVPLLRDVPLARSVDLNGAVRYADYSRSGGATTWKVGLTWDVDRSVRLRGTYSRDIRAPNLTELFTPSLSGLAVLIDPFRNESVAVNTFSNGNPDLRPEVGETLSAGVVLQPSFIPRLQFSADYYRIKLKGMISTSTPTVVVQRCYDGAKEFCDLITRSAATDGSALGPISSVRSPYLNLNRFDTWGLDFELSYRLPLDGAGLPGTLGARVLATYVGEYRRTDSAGSIDRAGQVIQSQDAGIADLQGTATLNYDVGRFSTALSFRYINGGVIDAGAVPNTPTGNNINKVDAAVYTNLSLTYTLGKRGAGSKSMQFFGYISNLFDKDPPFPAAEGMYYDVIGRAFRFGVRLTY